MRQVRRLGSQVVRELPLLASLILIAPVLAAGFLTQSGNGLLTTVIGVRLDAGGYSAQVAGLLTAAYYAGLLVGIKFAVRLVERVGHIRGFAALAAFGAVAGLAYALWPTPWFWMVLRFVGGFAVAGLFVVMESWLNMKATNETRGSIFSYYMVTNYAALAAGQMLLGVWDIDGFQLFSLAAIAMILALVPPSVTRQPAPTLTGRSLFRLRDLYRLSPVAVAGAGVSGAVIGPTYGLMPVYASGTGLSLGEVSLLMTTLILGGVLLAWPVGRVSDRFDRRLVIICVCTACALASVAILLAGGLSLLLLVALVAVFGGVGFTIYPLAVAHANDFVPAEDTVALTGGLLLVFGLGAMLGPPVASLMMDLLGYPALFLYMALAVGGLGAFTAYRLRLRPTVPMAEEARAPFVPLSQTSPVAYELEPWTPVEAVPDESDPAAEPPARPPPVPAV